MLYSLLEASPPVEQQSLGRSIVSRIGLEIVKDQARMGAGCRKRQAFKPLCGGVFQKLPDYKVKIVHAPISGYKYIALFGLV